MHKYEHNGEKSNQKETIPFPGYLWDLDIDAVTGHNLEIAGREEVNKLLKEGWVLLHIYTLKYKEDDTWRERPMAILGKPKHTGRKKH